MDQKSDLFIKYKYKIVAPLQYEMFGETFSFHLNFVLFTCVYSSYSLMNFINRCYNFILFIEMLFNFSPHVLLYFEFVSRYSKKTIMCFITKNGYKKNRSSLHYIVWKDYELYNDIFHTFHVSFVLYKIKNKHNQ